MGVRGTRAGVPPEAFAAVGDIVELLAGFAPVGDRSELLLNDLDTDFGENMDARGVPCGLSWP